MSGLSFLQDVAQLHKKHLFLEHISLWMEDTDFCQSDMHTYMPKKSFA